MRRFSTRAQKDTVMMLRSAQTSLGERFVHLSACGGRGDATCRLLCFGLVPLSLPLFCFLLSLLALLFVCFGIFFVQIELEVPLLFQRPFALVLCLFQPSLIDL